MFRLKQFEWYRRIRGGQYYVFSDGEFLSVQNYTKKSMIVINSGCKTPRIIYYPGRFAKPRILIQAKAGNRNA